MKNLKKFQPTSRRNSSRTCKFRKVLSADAGLVWYSKSHNEKAQTAHPRRFKVSDGVTEFHAERTHLGSVLYISD